MLVGARTRCRARVVAGPDVATRAVLVRWGGFLILRVAARCCGLCGLVRCGPPAAASTASRRPFISYIQKCQVNGRSDRDFCHLHTGAILPLPLVSARPAALPAPNSSFPPGRWLPWRSFDLSLPLSRNFSKSSHHVLWRRDASKRCPAWRRQPCFAIACARGHAANGTLPTQSSSSSES